ncbi:MAG TPA: hypothetical protein VGH89_01045 [Pseudonocardia sp.]
MLVKATVTTLAGTMGMLALFLATSIAVISSLTGAAPGLGSLDGPLDEACLPTQPPSVGGLRSDQIGDPLTRNAATIIAVGAQLGVPERGWLIALTAALTESGLRNLRYGDRDSLGLFQQRPSQGWGTPTHILNPRYSATQFYRHLLALPHWQQLSVNNAAQAVQRSATPTAYGPHEPTARALLNTLTHTPDPTLNRAARPTAHRAADPTGGRASAPGVDAVHPPATQHTNNTPACPGAAPLPCPPHPITTTPQPAAAAPSTPPCLAPNAGVP